MRNIISQMGRLSLCNYSSCFRPLQLKWWEGEAYGALIDKWRDEKECGRGGGRHGPSMTRKCHILSVYTSRQNVVNTQEKAGLTVHTSSRIYSQWYLIIESSFFSLWQMDKWISNRLLQFWSVCLCDDDTHGPSHRSDQTTHLHHSLSPAQSVYFSS